jgi:uncharacterized protein (TIGR02145 family)
LQNTKLILEDLVVGFQLNRFNDFFDTLRYGVSINLNRKWRGIRVGKYYYFSKKNAKFIFHLKHFWFNNYKIIPMKKNNRIWILNTIIIEVLFLLAFVLKTNAQNYQISFAGTGVTSTIDSVKVKNLTKGISLSILGSDVLNLQAATGIYKPISNKETILIKPNPMQGQAELSFYAKQPGNTQVVVFDISGKEVIQMSKKLLQGTHQYEIKGLKAGTYVIKINGDSYQYHVKLMSNNNLINQPYIKYLGNIANDNILRSTRSIVKMAYTTGDNLRFTGYSGIYTATIDDVPTSSKTITFTFKGLPDLTTKTVSAISTTIATCGGNITSDGSATITSKGVCWSITPNPTITSSKTTDGTDTGSFTSNITGLTPNTTYYVRAYATNSVGTGYGNQVFFTTNSINSCGTVSDIQGNVYHTVIIGTQCWMVENLKTTKYRNGDTIPNVTYGPAWDNLTPDSIAYCNYINDVSIGNTYGHLYNWRAISDSRNISPTGWHVPTDAEWTTLINFLGGDSVAGAKLKETGFAHWNNSSTSATNESGFTALPGGFRFWDGTFQYITYNAYWWSSTESNSTSAKSLILEGYLNKIKRNSYDKKRNGYSVRCVKD